MADRLRSDDDWRQREVIISHPNVDQPFHTWILSVCCLINKSARLRRLVNWQIKAQTSAEKALEIEEHGSCQTPTACSRSLQGVDQKKKRVAHSRLLCQKKLPVNYQQSGWNWIFSDTAELPPSETWIIKSYWACHIFYVSISLLYVPLKHCHYFKCWALHDLTTTLLADKPV